jgi:hypothetical protein
VNVCVDDAFSDLISNDVSAEQPANAAVQVVQFGNEGKSINKDKPEDNMFKDFDVDSFKYQTPPEDDSKETKKEG